MPVAPALVEPLVALLPLVVPEVPVALVTPVPLVPLVPEVVGATPAEEDDPVLPLVVLLLDAPCAGAVPVVPEPPGRTALPVADPVPDADPETAPPLPEVPDVVLVLSVAKADETANAQARGMIHFFISTPFRFRETDSSFPIENDGSLEFGQLINKLLQPGGVGAGRCRPGRHRHCYRSSAALIFCRSFL